MRLLGSPRTAMLAALMMQGLVPIASASPDPEPCRVPPRREPYLPPKREPPPLTPEQIKAQAKRARKAAKMKGTP